MCGTRFAAHFLLAHPRAKICLGGSVSQLCPTVYYGSMAVRERILVEGDVPSVILDSEIVEMRGRS